MKRVAVLLGAMAAVFVMLPQAAQGGNIPSGDNSLAQSLTVQLGSLLDARKLQGTGTVPDAALSALIARREQAMLELAKTNPAAFLVSVLPKEKRQLVPQSLQAQVEQEGPLAGTLEVFHADDFDHPENSRNSYFLNVTQDVLSRRIALKSIPAPRRIELYPTGDLPFPSGTKLRFKSAYRLEGLAAGDVSADNLDVDTVPKPDAIGNKKLLVFLVDFADAPSPPFTAAWLKERLFNGTISNFYKEQSYGKVSFTGEVYGWFKSEKTGKAVANGFFAEDAEVQKFIKEEKIDIRDYDHIALLLNSKTYFGGRGTVGKVDVKINDLTSRVSLAWVGNVPEFGKGFYESSQPFTWDRMLEGQLAHELGHNLGLYEHANSLHCGENINVGSCLHEEYGNYFSIMGHYYYGLHFDAFQKEKLGWIDPREEVIITAPGEYALDSLEEKKSSVKLGQIIISRNPYRALYLEHRKAVGFDAKLDRKDLADNQKGLFIYDVKDDGGTEANLLDMTPSGTSGGDQFVTLNGNSVWNDRSDGIVIGPVSSFGNQIRFSVDFTTPECIKSPPRSYVPNSPIAGAESVFVILKVINNNSWSCGAPQFDVSLLPHAEGYFIKSSSRLGIQWIVVEVNTLKVPAGKYPVQLKVRDLQSGSETLVSTDITVVPFPRVTNDFLSGSVGTEVALEVADVPEKGTLLVYITRSEENAVVNNAVVNYTDVKNVRFTVPPVSPGQYKLLVYSTETKQYLLGRPSFKVLTSATRSEISKTTGKEVVTSGPLQTARTPIMQSVIDALRKRVEELWNKRNALQNQLDAIKRERAIQSGARIIPSGPHLPAAPLREQLGDISAALQSILEPVRATVR